MPPRLISCAAWILAIVGLFAANSLFFFYVARGEWGWAAVNLVMIIVNCVSLGANLWVFLLSRRPRWIAWLYRRTR